MAQISVVQYNVGVSQKLNVLQQSVSANSNDRHIVVLRKPQAIQPKDDILITNPRRKGGGGKKGGKELKTSPQPVAVARRNARERNRVKQVNNGFANLRQHIPNFIAQAFESSNGRGNKKLSKVETLRMAVEYIRSLEEILTLDGYTIPKVENEISSPTSQADSNGDLGYHFDDDDDDDFSSVATPSPQQFIRINTTNNTYEIVQSTVYENTENMDPMTVDQQLLADSNLLVDSGLDLNTQELSYLHVNTAGSISPGIYSESSLSPSNETLVKNLPQNCFIPVFANGGSLGNNFNVHVKTELDDIPVIALRNDVQELQDDVVEHWWNPNAGHS